MKMRNKSKSLTLERRLFVSYMTIIFIAILISFTLFTISANHLFTYRVEESMRTQLNFFVETINSNPHRPPSRAINENLLKMIQSDVIIITDDKVNLATDLELVEKIAEHPDGWGYAERNYIVMYETVNVYSGVYEIILLSEKGMIRELNQINLNLLFIASLASIIIASFLSIYAQNTIARPILELKKKVNDFRESLVAPRATIFTRDEIQDLDENLVQMAEAIVRNDRKRKSFFENTSHELKTPLMNIRGYAEGIKDGIFTVDEAAEIILQESNSLSTMVESILYLSKLEDATYDHYQWQIIDVNKFLTGFYDKVAGLVSERGLELKLELDKSVKVQIDDDKMIRALSNVITNAVRYAKSIIRIQTVIGKERLNIRIFNDGPPVSDEDLAHLFDRFYKGYKGQSGLGLSILQSIIVAHGGEVEAVNVKDGFCMNVSVPYIKGLAKNKSKNLD